jgi:hypothetical protein
MFYESRQVTHSQQTIQAAGGGDGSLFEGRSEPSLDEAFSLWKESLISLALWLHEWVNHEIDTMI